MSKKSQRKRKKLDPQRLYGGEGLFDEASDLDFEMDAWSADEDEQDWWDDDPMEERVSVRRKIERRREKQQLYSELNDWEVFGRQL